MRKIFSILITTKNRLGDLKTTLNHLSALLQDSRVEFLVYDDASTDGTFDYVKENYPFIQLFRNNQSKGYIHNRNVLLNQCTGDYAISLDDDAHFLSEAVLDTIALYFENHLHCAVIACRIFWGLEPPISRATNEPSMRVKGFVGCGHVWRMDAWRAIPNYPAWFIFYGEEAFAGYHLFKKGWEVHYVPQLLVHHRVAVKSRKNAPDYSTRTRRALRSAWYMYFMFYPISQIPRKIGYSIYAQIKLKTIKGDYLATLGLVRAMVDVLVNCPKIYKNSKRFSKQEMNNYQKLPETKIYWKPD
jgi:glycosyltransferase involved in cell wall biosynthesis